MTPTTITALRSRFSRAIKGIVPTTAPSKRWHNAAQVAEVSGSINTRLFYLRFSAPTRPANGFYGTDAYEAEVTMEVITSYEAVDDWVDDVMLSSDGFEVEETLSDLYDPGIPGLVSVQYSGFDFADSAESSGGFGSHTYTVRYARADRTP